jgi:hypothetical protein
LNEKVDDRSMRIFLLVFDRTVIELDISPALTLKDFRAHLISVHSLPAGRYTFLHGGRFLDQQRPFLSVPENSKVILIIDVPENDPHYHWPPTLPCMESLPITTDDATFANLHLPELYNESLSIWRNPERAQEAVEVLRRSPSLLLHYTNFMRNHQSIIAAFPHRNAFFPLALLGFVPNVGEVVSDAEIEISLLPGQRRDACRHLIDMEFEPQAVLEVMRRTNFEEAPALAILIERYGKL